jgi:CRISPR-associated exonuclease Cas4
MAYIKSPEEIQKIIESEKCPDIINSKICKSCSYYEFCYVEEPDI